MSSISNVGGPNPLQQTTALTNEAAELINNSKVNQNARKKFEQMAGNGSKMGVPQSITNAKLLGATLGVDKTLDPKVNPNEQQPEKVIKKKAVKTPEVKEPEVKEPEVKEPEEEKTVAPEKPAKPAKPEKVETPETSDSETEGTQEDKKETATLIQTNQLLEEERIIQKKMEQLSVSEEEQKTTPAQLSVSQEEQKTNPTQQENTKGMFRSFLSYFSSSSSAKVEVKSSSAKEEEKVIEKEEEKVIEKEEVKSSSAKVEVKSSSAKEEEKVEEKEEVKVEEKEAVKVDEKTPVKPKSGWSIFNPCYNRRNVGNEE